MGDDQPPQKLPVWRTVKAAYLVIFFNPKLALKLAVVPLVLMLASGAITASLFAGQSVTELTETGRFHVIGLGSSLIIYLSMIPTITAWHRLVLLGHGNPDARISYSIQSTEWAYLWKMVLFVLLIIVLSIPMILGTSVVGGIVAVASRGSGQSLDAQVIIIIVAAVAANVFVYGLALRFNLVFPSAAIGAPMGFRDSWRRTRGNTWRLIFIALITVIPFYLVPFGIGLAFTDFQRIPSVEQQVLISLINTPFWLLGVCVGISFWSWSYRFLVQGLPITLPDD